MPDTGWNLDNTYATLPEAFFSRLHPVPVQAPKLVLLNEGLARDLGFDVRALRDPRRGTAVFAGNEVPPGAAPLAQAYAGHQFGHFTMLGDGRALLLGEQRTPGGDRVDIQLKGSGRTPYSRGGDGRAALGPMLREYIISEAMHALGIPTTRGLAVVLTGETVVRESLLPGAILTRVAGSHLRVGTFEFARARRNQDELQALADYAIERHGDEIDIDDPERYRQFLQEVVDRQAALVAQWQLVGFIHGVMNTDNMTISGETIDYGPCAFMNAYDPGTVFSSIDRQGRYAYGNQPGIAGWNLTRFAETLLPLLHDEEQKAVDLAQTIVSGFPDIYDKYWFEGMRAKLGLNAQEDDDQELIQDLLQLMHNHGADYTDTFRHLTLDDPEQTAMHGDRVWSEWVHRWRKRQDRDRFTEDQARRLMQQTNPAVIPRNHQVEAALSAMEEDNDPSVMEHLLDILADPFAYSAAQKDFAQSPVPPGPYVTFCGT